MSERSLLCPLASLSIFQTVTNVHRLSFKVLPEVPAANAFWRVCEGLHG